MHNYSELLLRDTAAIEAMKILLATMSNAHSPRLTLYDRIRQWLRYDVSSQLIMPHVAIAKAAYRQADAMIQARNA